MKRVKTVALGAVVISSICVTQAEAQVTVSTGADYSSGSYGTGQRIRTASASVAVRVKRKRVSAFATLPVVRTEAPGNVVVTGGPLGLPILVDPTRPAMRVRRDGLGDATLGASVQLLEPRLHKLALAVGGSAKLPTASAAKGLGTGKADFAVTAEIARPGKVTPFAAIGHTAVGQPAEYRLNDVTSMRGGLALRVGKASEVSLSYNHASPVNDAIPGRREIATGIETALSQRLSLGVQGGAGLSRGAPDASAGLRLGLRM